MISKLWNLIIFFFRAKKEFHKPIPKEILLYDASHKDLLINYIDASNIHILSTRGESINIYVLISLFFSLKNPLSIREYALYTIQLVNPKIIITFIDNYIDFYSIKNVFPNINTIFIQNGLRGVVGDIFGEITKKKYENVRFQVDYMFVLGQAIGQKYNKYINGNIIPIGTFKNNLFQKKVLCNHQNAILFISQFRPKNNNWVENGITVTHEDFYSAEHFLLKILHQFSIQNNIKFQIASVSDKEDCEENDFYASIFGKDNWEFLLRKDKFSNYEYIDASRYVITIDSTLGYEALARGKKVGYFHIRSFANIEKPYPFGWPEILPDDGPFWTNIKDEVKINNVMNYLLDSSDEDWVEIRKRYCPHLIEYDPDNLKFVSLMKSLEIPIRSDSPEMY